MARKFKNRIEKKLVKLRNLSFMYDELWIKRSVTWDNEKKSKKNLLPPQHFREINQKTKPKTILIPVIQKKDKKEVLSPSPPSPTGPSPLSKKRPRPHNDSMMVNWLVIEWSIDPCNEILFILIQLKKLTLSRNPKTIERIVNYRASDHKVGVSRYLVWHFW